MAKETDELINLIEEYNVKRVNLLYFGSTESIKAATKQMNEAQEKYKKLTGSYHHVKKLNV